MSESIKCSGTMTKFNVNVKKDNIYSCFSIQVVEDSTVRTFPGQFKRINLSVFDTMAANDVFDKINVPCEEYNLKYVMQFDELEFEAKLESMSACIKKTKDGVPYTVYNMNFIKEIEKENDLKLASFVKYKEEDPETGKKKVKFFNVSLDYKD